jgi:hypothetical protein
MSGSFIVESDIIIRAVDKPFPQRQIMGIFDHAEGAYHFIEKYLSDTKELHTYFARQFICTMEELSDYIKNDRMVAFNIVLGQFEDMIYVRPSDSAK